MSENRKVWKLPLSVPKKNDRSSSSNNGGGSGVPHTIWPGSRMKELEGLLETRRMYPAIIVPAKETANTRKLLKHVLIKRQKLKDVYPVDNSNGKERKLVLEHHSSSSNHPENVMEDAVFQDETVARLLSSSSKQDCNQTDSSINHNHNNSSGEKSLLFRKSKQLICIEYKDLTVDQVLKKLLPSLNGNTNESSSSTPTSFETVGHVAHVNLRDDPNLMPFKFLIGQVILAKNYPNIQIVVNKTGIIDNVYRTFPMEVLASRIPPSRKKEKKKKNDDSNPNSKDDSLYAEGEICKDLPITLREQGNLFHFDFCKVYWNSRLQAEHHRVVTMIATSVSSLLRPNQPLIVADACAGVGPFAIPLAANYNNKTKIIQVHANDLNPYSYQYLLHNQKLNHKKINNNNSSSSSLTCYNMDAQQFIRHLVTDKNIFPNHFIMNLPASAPELLTAFRGYPKQDHITNVHVHCFAPKLKLNPQSHKEAIERCEASLGCKLDLNHVSIHIVRDVSPTNNMLCISFQLPPMDIVDSESSSPQIKKPRLTS